MRSALENVRVMRASYLIFSHKSIARVVDAVNSLFW